MVGHRIYSILDGFNGYNQIPMAQKDSLKTYLLQNGDHLYIE